MGEKFKDGASPVLTVNFRPRKSLLPDLLSLGLRGWGSSRSYSKLSPAKIPATQLTAPGSPRLFLNIHPSHSFRTHEKLEENKFNAFYKGVDILKYF